MKQLFEKLFKIIIGLFIIIIGLIIYDRFFSERFPFISDENINQIKHAEIVLIGSSHTQFHIIPDTLAKLTNKKIAVLASGGSYLIDNIYLLNTLDQMNYLNHKIVFTQFELYESFNNHSQKSYYALNLPLYIYKQIFTHSNYQELKIFLTSVLIDIFYIEDFTSRPQGNFQFKKCEEVRIRKPFPLEQFLINSKQGNGNSLGDSYSNPIIDAFNDKMYNQKKFNYINYIALGSNNGKYIQDVKDLRWNSQFADTALWWDSNHLNFKGANHYTKLFFKEFYFYID